MGPDPGHPGHPGHPLAGRGSRVGERRPTLQRISGTTVARASTAIGAKVNVAAAARFRERKVTRRTPVAASGDSGAAAAKTWNAPCGSCRMEPIGPAAGPGTLGLASGCPGRQDGSSPLCTLAHPIRPARIDPRVTRATALLARRQRARGEGRISNPFQFSGWNCRSRDHRPTGRVGQLVSHFRIKIMV